MITNHFSLSQMGSAITIDHLPKPKPARDFIFKGKWLVRYDAKDFSYAEILALLPALQDRLQRQKLNAKYINLKFSRTVVRNRFFSFADHVFILHNGSEKRLAETDPGAFAVQTNLAPLSSPISSVNLFFPRLDSDPRWKSMGLPASQLFLASALQANGFRVSPRLLSLPAAQPLAEELSADMAGFSLFEDLLPLLKPFLAGFHALYHGWLTAGGPFITLAPMAAVTHLPQVNLFIRGEAEQELPLILDALNRGDADALLRHKGLFWQQPGLIIMADFDRVNRPETFSRFKVNFDFLRPEHLRHGLEMNFSRGCSRGCLFCCRAQGTKIRKLPLEKAEELLKKYKQKVDSLTETSGSPRQEPPPLVRGVDNKNLFHGDLSSHPPLIKGGKRGDSDFGTVTTSHTLPAVSLSPWQEPPPLVKGVDETKSSNRTKRGLMNQTPTTGNFSSCPPLLKGGDRGDFFISESNSTPPAASQSPWQEPPPLVNGVFQGNIEMAHPININDDDILQDPLYAAAVFALIKKHGFRIHGIQTSPASFMESDDRVRSAVLDLVADRDLYVDDRPLLWLGSDVFLSRRTGRLGKKLPSAAAFAALLAEFEKRGLRHFHYWISSDGDSTWEEFVDELALILGFYRDFPGFGLLAHAPFIVPYPSSRMFQRLEAGDPRLKVKLALEAADPRFSYSIVDHIETRWPQLNNLLRNEKAGGEKGFFDLLKEKEFIAAAQLTYHFLKQEELQSLDPDSGLIKARERLERTIAEILENRNT